MKVVVQQLLFEWKQKIIVTFKKIQTPLPRYCTHMCAFIHTPGPQFGVRVGRGLAWVWQNALFLLNWETWATNKFSSVCGRKFIRQYVWNTTEFTHMTGFLSTQDRDVENLVFSEEAKKSWLFCTISKCVFDP